MVLNNDEYVFLIMILMTIMMSRVDSQQILSYDAESGNEPGPHTEGKKYPQHCNDTAPHTAPILLSTLGQYIFH